MSNGPTGELTSGYLPMTAFEHLEPTAVCVVDLEHSIVPRTPDGRPWNRAQRDGLLLIRLHGEPLTVIHTDRHPSALTREELATAVWRSAGQHIHRHIRPRACASVPAGAGALASGLDLTGDCPDTRPADVRPSAAVILCTAGRAQLGRCIRSLLAQCHPDLELVVVDNRPASGKARAVVRAIAAEDPRVRYVPEPRPGLSVARNRGVAATRADVVAFTDDDVVVDPHWLDWLLAPFADPNVMASCGMVMPLELQTAAQKRFEQYAGFSKGFTRRAYGLHDGPVPGRLLYPYVNGVVGVGNNMAFRREELVRSGGFDPALGAGSPTGACEETCAFSRTILGGGLIVYEPRALCWHEHRNDEDALREQVFSYGVGLGAALTKALTSDPGFYVTASRSLAIALAEQLRRKRASPSVNGTRRAAAMVRPEELMRARRQGIARGPIRYVAGVARSHRYRLRDVIRGG